jgi:hypothetical protein
MPVRIHGLDQSQLFVPQPPFDFLLPGNGIARMGELFVPNHPRKIVTACESIVDFVLVFPNPSRQISGDACIENMQALIVGHDVNSVAFRILHSGAL